MLLHLFFVVTVPYFWRFESGRHDRADLDRQIKIHLIQAKIKPSSC